MKEIMPIERIEQRILVIRGQKVMLDRDLARLYGIGTRDLNKAVSRNLDRFPSDFMFQLIKSEYDNLKFQFGTSKLKSQIAISSWGGIRKLPRVFTEQGVAMLSSVLRSKRAVQMNILIMRAFVKLRTLLATHKELSQKFKELESRVGKHDTEIQAICKVIKQMLAIEKQPKKRIGFDVGRGGA